MFRLVKYINKPSHIQYKINKEYHIKNNLIKNNWIQLYKHLEKNKRQKNKDVKSSDTSV